jgi:hypothetical protein
MLAKLPLARTHGLGPFKPPTPWEDSSHLSRPKCIFGEQIKTWATISSCYCDVILGQIPLILESIRNAFPMLARPHQKSMSSSSDVKALRDRHQQS